MQAQGSPNSEGQRSVDISSQVLLQRSKVGGNLSLVLVGFCGLEVNLIYLVVKKEPVFSLSVHELGQNWLLGGCISGIKRLINTQPGAT